MNNHRLQLHSHQPGRAYPPRRGAIFILSLAVIVILSGLVLVFAQEMRTEALASANRVSYVQAEAVEQGAEQWVLAQVESNAPDAITITQTTAEALQVGNGYFWVLSPDPTQDQTYTFGITDEAGKINLSTSALWTTPPTLPGLTADMVSSITDWQSVSDTTDPNGAGGSYYQSLQEPYNYKGTPFESVEELLLVKDITPQVLYGYDLNHDGVVDSAERNQAGQGSTMSVSGGSDSRGFFNYVTCFSSLPSAPPGGTALVNVNSPGLQNVLSSTPSIGPGKAATYIANARRRIGPGGLITSLAAFYRDSGMLPAEYGVVADKLTASTGAKTLLNVNTASEQALMCLPTITQATADAVIGARTNATKTDMSWFFNVIPANQIASVADSVTDKSYQYSADIVAVSGDGRAFKRVRIVVDASKYPTLPAQIIYRKDLTSLGWPLPPEYRASLRAGVGPPDSLQAGGSAAGGSGLNLGMTTH